MPSDEERIRRITEKLLELRKTTAEAREEILTATEQLLSINRTQRQASEDATRRAGRIGERTQRRTRRH